MRPELEEVSQKSEVPFSFLARGSELEEKNLARGAVDIAEARGTELEARGTVSLLFNYILLLGFLLIFYDFVLIGGAFES